MKTSLRILAAAVTVSLASALSLAAAPAWDQPHMDAALDFLHKAQGAPETIPLLRAAKKQLEESGHDKGGFRMEAIRIINLAIDEAELHHPVKVEEDIAAAIKAIREGIAVAPR